MSTETEAPVDDLVTATEQDIARRALVAAARFAAVAMAAFSKEHPDQAELMAAAGAPFSVRVVDVLAQRPRVALFVTIGGKETEIAHKDLERKGDSITVLH